MKKIFRWLLNEKPIKVNETPWDKYVDACIDEVLAYLDKL